MLVVAFKRHEGQVSGVPDGPHDGFGEDRDADSRRNEDHKGLRIGRAGVDPGDKAGFSVFVGDDVAVLFGRGVVVILGKKKRLVPQVIAADGGQLRVGVSGRQDCKEPVAAKTLISKTGQIRIAVDNVEQKVQSSLFQIHQKIQV